jgi:hypothetical protein
MDGSLFPPSRSLPLLIAAFLKQRQWRHSWLNFSPLSTLYILRLSFYPAIFNQSKNKESKKRHD